MDTISICAFGICNEVSKNEKKSNNPAAKDRLRVSSRCFDIHFKVKIGIIGTVDTVPIIPKKVCCVLNPLEATITDLSLYTAYCI